MLQRLAEDIGRGAQRLYEMVSVYRAYPIFRAPGKLRWTHFVTLASVKDAKVRGAYEQVARRRAWSSRTLKDQISQGVFEDEDGRLADGWDRREPPEPRRGRPYTYRVKEISGSGIESGMRVVLDLGMGAEHELVLEEGGDLAVGDIVRTERRPLPGPPRNGEGGVSYSSYRIGRGERGKLYTYKAEVIRVVDGDTVWMKVDFGFRFRQVLKVRLRGVDAPELAEAEGQRAKEWLEARLDGVPFVVITTSKVGKYGRYIADVFVAEGQGLRAEGVAKAGVYLNGEMVEYGKG